MRTADCELQIAECGARLGTGASIPVSIAEVPCVGHGPAGGPAIRNPHSAIREPQFHALLVLVAAAWAVFSWALVAQHRAFQSHAYDLGFFDQIIWNTSHGRWFATTFVPYNFLGQHMEPVLLPFAALYRLWPQPEA